MSRQRRPPAVTRVARITGYLAVVLSLALLLPSPAAAQDVSLKATAGLDGQVRPGRWAPVRVQLTSQRTISGQLIVDWGDAHVTRAVSLSDGVPRQYELYARTTDPRDVIAVRLDADGGTVVSTEVPVRVIGYDAAIPPLIVCGARLAQEQGTRNTCSTTLDAASVPRSWRGLSAADELRFSPTDLAFLDPARRRAVTIATAQARLNRVGLGSPTMSPVPAARRYPGRSSLVLGGYVVALSAALLLAQWRRSAATIVLLLIAAGAGAAAVYGSVHVGTGSAILVHHATAIDQYEGAEGSVVTMRGVAEFPAFADYSLRADSDDAAMSTASAPASLHFDLSGAPIIAGAFGLGSGAEFIFEGAVASGLVRFDRSGRVLRISNVSAVPLLDCVFSGSAAPDAPRSLAPGAHMTATLVEEEADPTVTCALKESPWGFSELRHPVVMNGTASLVLHFNPLTGDAASESDR